MTDVRTGSPKPPAKLPGELRHELRVAEVAYRPRRRARSTRPGMHAGLERGDGLEPIGHDSLVDGRDPRRLVH